MLYSVGHSYAEEHYDIHSRHQALFFFFCACTERAWWNGLYDEFPFLHGHYTREYKGTQTATDPRVPAKAA